MSGTPEPPGRRTRDGSARSQSDVLAISMLFGMVFLGAGIVLLAGTVLVGDVQENSQQDLARSAAEQTQHQVQQALVTGEVREIPSGEMASIQSRVVDEGSIELEMYNGSTGTCRRVPTDMGAIVYETEGGEVIYEGGAIWQREEAGLSVQSPPNIDYEAEGGTDVSVMTVSPGGEAGVIQPNVTARAETNRQIEDMLVECARASRAGGPATNMNITVSSPFADAWDRYFRDSMADSANVTVYRSDDTVTASIENATDVLREDWLWIRDHDLESGLVLPGEDIETSVTVRNTGPRQANGTVTLQVHGEPGLPQPSQTVNLSAGEQQDISLDITGDQLNGTENPTIDAYDWYNYSVTLDQDVPAEMEISTLNETVYYGLPEDELVVRDVGHEFRNDGNFLDIRASIYNLGFQDANETVQLFVEDQEGNRGVIQPTPSTYAAVNATQSGLVEFTLNTSRLNTGHYNGIVELDGGNEPDETGNTWFEINNSIQAGVGNVTLGASGNATVSVMGTEVSAESIQDVSLPDHERPNTALQRSQESMVGATYLEHQSGGPGWVPAERQNGSWVETGESPDCSGWDETFYGDHDSWNGWYVQDCWEDAEGFVWDDTDGYDFRWVMAGQTDIEHGGTVSRQDTNWVFRDVDDPTRDPSEQEYTKYWSPVTMEVVIDSPDEGTDRIPLPTSTQSLDNLNTHDTQEREWTWDGTLSSGTEVTLEAGYWACTSHGTSYHTRTDEHGHEWLDENCDHRSSYDYLTVDASQGENTDNVQVLQDGDVLPELRAGYPDQRSADEVLNTGAEERINATTGELDLGDNEAVFLFELTDEDATWEDAFEQEWLGDPNYNDAIVLFEYEPREEVIPLENVSGIDGGDGTIPPLNGSSDPPAPGDSDPGSDINVDAGHVVIG